jgi:hypothetical protein
MSFTISAIKKPILTKGNRACLVLDLDIGVVRTAEYIFQVAEKYGLRHDTNIGVIEPCLAK